MHLARLELRVLYAQWLKRIPTFSLSRTNPPRFHGGVVIGLEKLPLQWSPQAAADSGTERSAIPSRDVSQAS
jgi:hypothetical protein